jgi:hypothetical protein
MGSRSMKDYNYVTDEGTLIPTAQLTTAKIQELLAEGVQIVEADGQDANPENVMERLRIELVIRELGL